MIKQEVLFADKKLMVRPGIEPGMSSTTYALRRVSNPLSHELPHEMEMMIEFGPSRS